MNKDLAPSHKAPQEHGQGKEPLWPQDLGDHVKGNLGDDEADDEEALREVDVVVVDGRVFTEGVGQRVGYVGAIELEEDEEEHYEGHD